MGNICVGPVIRLNGIGIRYILCETQAAIITMPNHKIFAAYRMIFQREQWIDSGTVTDRAAVVMNSSRHKAALKISCKANKGDNYLYVGGAAFCSMPLDNPEDSGANWCSYK